MAIDPSLVRVQGRDRPCPHCGTTAWFGPRAFAGQVTSYFLCKWCGCRWTLLDTPESPSLAIPVFHRCTPSEGVLTWHLFEGEPYREKKWTCSCGASLKVMDTLRPYPRFAADLKLAEQPGD